MVCAWESRSSRSLSAWGYQAAGLAATTPSESEISMPCKCGCGTAATIDEKSQPDVVADACGCDSTASERELKLVRVVAELDQRLRELEGAR
jgi:hypothetical protein